MSGYYHVGDEATQHGARRLASLGLHPVSIPPSHPVCSGPVYWVA